MPKLLSCLQGQDLGYLRIVAGLWGVELAAGEARADARQLVPLLLERERFIGMLRELPASARQAVDELIENQGHLGWQAFTRKYGELPEMGAGKRDREKPFANDQASVSEMLYYRALLARVFLDTPAGPAEFAVLPDEWLSFLSPANSHPQISFGRPASPAERGRVIPVDDSLLEDACTLLAGLRCSVSASQLQADLRCGRGTPFPLQAGMLETLLREAGLVDDQHLPVAEAARQFLEAPRPQSLAWLARAWLNSAAFNEMRWLPGVTSEGTWRNDPLRTRKTVLSFLAGIPGGKAALGVAGKPWWSLQAFINAVYQHYPDFQRQAGEYEAWFVKSATGGESLSGFHNWERVEGELLRFMLAGPLHWLGILELATGKPENQEASPDPAAFRFSPWSSALLEGSAPAMQAGETGSLVVRSNGSLQARPGAPRAGRYQVARFCEWHGEKEGTYRYRITHAALQKASQQGLKVEHVLGILNRYAQAVPPSLVQGLRRWEAQGSQVRLEQLTVLRVKDPQLLKLLRSSDASRYLGEPLGATAVVVKPGAWDKLSNALAESGYLAEEIPNNQ